MSASSPHSVRYSTIVADPPWAYDEGWPKVRWGRKVGSVLDDPTRPRRDLPYKSMGVGEIAALPISALAYDDAHLFLWTTNRYLRQTYDVVEAWGFVPSQTLVWCKPPQGFGPGGLFASVSEFVLYARKGRPKHNRRVERNWWEWPRGWRDHSKKPEAFIDLVESVCPGPYLELFARRQRLGWDTWGNEALEHVEVVA